MPFPFSCRYIFVFKYASRYKRLSLYASFSQSFFAKNAKKMQADQIALSIWTVQSMRFLVGVQLFALLCRQ